MCTKEEVREVLEEKEWFVPKSKCSLRTNEINTNIVVMKKDIEIIKESQAEIKDLLKGMDAKFVSKIEFKPVRLIVYGMASSVLLAVFGALVASILK